MRTMKRWMLATILFCGSTFQTAYEYTNFDKQTEWGNWLNTVESHPTLDNPMGGYTKPKE